MSQTMTPPGYGASINLETARKVASAAVAEGIKNGWTVAVAIVDTGGDLVYFERLDGTQVASSKVAQDKARTAARFKRPSKLFEDALAGGRLAILGLDGVTSQQDGVCAQAGADVLGRPTA
jgi:glc operon protein GlcG